MAGSVGAPDTWSQRMRHNSRKHRFSLSELSWNSARSQSAIDMHSVALEEFDSGTEMLSMKSADL